MSRPLLSVTIITLNEARNIGRAIESVRSFADEILVVDSGSTDRTCEIAREIGATVIENPWRGYGQQKNFAMDHARNDWVLNIDADEAVSPELALELQNALTRHSAEKASGYSVPRLSFYLGRWIHHGGWYPNRLVRVAHRKTARWTEPEVHEALEVRGAVRPLRHDLLHYPFATLGDQIETNLKFSKLGSDRLRREGQTKSWVRLLLKPVGKFLETYVFKRGFLDGMPGFIISVNAAHSLFLKFAHLYDEKPVTHERIDHR